MGRQPTTNGIPKAGRKRGARHKQATAPREITLDVRHFDGGGLHPETRLTVSDILEAGTKDEIRKELEVIAAYLGTDVTRPGRLGPKHPAYAYLPQPHREWLRNALTRIANGEDANQVFGLKRKQHLTLQDTLNREYLADDLQRQGLSRDEALHLAANYEHPERLSRREQDGAALAKRIARLRPRSRTKSRRDLSSK